MRNLILAAALSLLCPTLRAADFQESNLVGTWAGTSLAGARIVYTFQKNGSVLWQSDDATFKSAYPSGLRGNWSLTQDVPVWDLDLKNFSPPTLSGVTFQGILQPLSVDQFKLEGRLSTQGNRPESFSAEAIVFSRTNASLLPTLSGGEGGKSGNPSRGTSGSAGANPSRPAGSSAGSVGSANGNSRRHTFSAYASGYGMAVAAIKTDGTVMLREPNFAAKSIPYFKDVVDLAPNTRFAKTADGNWWFLGTTTQKVPLSSPGRVNSISQAGGQLVGLLSDGAAFITFGSFELSAKPASVLDHIVSLSSQDNFNRNSHRFSILRADGTVWTTPSEVSSYGWVSTAGDSPAKQLKGLDNVKELSVYSLDQFDTGIALKADGSVVYWGVGDPVATKSAPNSSGTYTYSRVIPPIDAPVIKSLPLSIRIIKVAAGAESIGYIDADGHVWVQGGGAFFKLPASTLPSGISAAPFVIAGIEGAIDLQLTEGLALALCRDGSLWSWSSKQAPKKIMDNIMLPDGSAPSAVPPPAAVLAESPSAAATDNPLIGKWRFWGDESAFFKGKQAEFTATDMILVDGTRVPIKYRIEANTVTVIQPDPAPPLTCTLHTVDSGEVIAGNPAQPLAPRFGLVRFNGPPEDTCKLCNDIARQYTTQADKDESIRLCHMLIGATIELNARRKVFMDDPHFIDLFATVYYNATVTELNRLAHGSFDYPIEHMQLMLAFFAAYKSNRESWDRNKTCEQHWKDFFMAAADGDEFVKTPSNLKRPWAKLQEVLNSAIRAHVDFDLARALSYSYQNRFHPALNKTQLKDEFYKGDQTLMAAGGPDMADISVAADHSKGLNGLLESPYAMAVGNKLGESKLGEIEVFRYFFDIKSEGTVKDVIKRRHAAWDIFADEKPMPATNPQPQIDTAALEKEGKDSCR